MINKIKNLFRGNESRENTQTLSFQERSRKGNYISLIIKKKYYDFYKIEHRKAVCQVDGPAKKLTYNWRDTAFAKTPKFYSSHEVDAKEVMEDYRKKLTEMNVWEIFKKAVVPFVRDGNVLIHPIKKTSREGDITVDYDVWGEYECPPSQWIRMNNKIVQYRVQYTPKPRAFASSLSMIDITTHTAEQLGLVNELYQAKDIIHVERGEPNWGYGDSLIEGCWDSIIKLALGSHDDMMNTRKVPELHVPESYYSTDEEKVQGILKMVANSDEDTSRVWYHYQLPTQEVTDYPKFAYSSASGTVAGGNTTNKTEGISTGDYGNINKEWIRLCTITGHTIHYFAGNRAGAVTGSETDTDADINQEIIDFGQLEPIMRKVFEWLDKEGILPLPTEPFVIKYWKDWENIEAKAKKEEQMLQQNPNLKNGQFPLDKTQGNKPLQDKRNELIVTELLNCWRNNMSYPMTEVMSSWIRRIGYSDKTDRLYMELLSGQAYSKPAPMGEWSYLDWAEAGSKGGYFWDYLSQRDPPWQIDTIPADLFEFGSFAGTPEEMAKYKVSLVGVSREPFSVEDVKKHNDSRSNPFGGYKDWDDCISKNRDKSDPEAYCGEIKSKTEGKHNTINYSFERIPMLDYQLIDKLDTRTKIKRFAQKQGWSMGNTTADSIKNMFESLKQNANKHQLRISTLNAEAFGNSIKEHHALRYDIGNGVIVEEYICPESWKKNVGKTVSLGVYHNLEAVSPELPEWQIVGTAEIFGWDSDLGEDYVKYNYDYDAIATVFERLNQYDWLTPTLKNNLTSDISTAYYCDIEYRWSDALNKMVRVQTNIDLKSISFVPRGNCPGEVCSLIEVKRNIMAMQEFIKNCLNSGEKKEQCLATAYTRFKAQI